MVILHNTDLLAAGSGTFTYTAEDVRSGRVYRVALADAMKVYGAGGEYGRSVAEAEARREAAKVARRLGVKK